MLLKLKQDRTMIGKIHNENCLDTMGRMPDGFVDLTVTSPPYDNLRDYNGYEFDWKSVIKELHRVIKNGAVVVWIVSDATISGSETGTSFKQALFAMEMGFKLYDTMIWSKPSPQAPTEGRYYETFEYMFIFSKGKPKTLNLLTDRKNISAGSVSNKETRSSREDRQTLKGKRTVADFSRRFNVWQISRGKNETQHPAVFPEKLVADHIKSWSNKGDIVYDPFCGSGTTPKMAHKLNRKWIASEISKEYVELSNKRLDPILRQTMMF